MKANAVRLTVYAKRAFFQELDIICMLYMYFISALIYSESCSII